MGVLDERQVFQIPRFTQGGRSLVPYETVFPTVQVGFEDSATVRLCQTKKSSFRVSPPDHDYLLNLEVVAGETNWLTLEFNIDPERIVGCTQITVQICATSSEVEPFHVGFKLVALDGVEHYLHIGTFETANNGQFTSVNLSAATTEIPKHLRNNPKEGRIILFGPKEKSSQFTLAMINIFMLSD